MIKSWKQKGLKDLFLTGSKKSIRPDIADRLRRRLDVLDAVNSLKAFGLPGFQAAWFERRDEREIQHKSYGKLAADVSLRKWRRF